MATRATYRFDDQRGIKDRQYERVDIYIHHDGYPAGAAEYFKIALDAKRESSISSGNPRRGLLESFLTGNKRSEITHNYTKHKDTEYHYILIQFEDEYQFQAFSKNIEGGDFHMFFDGTLEEFINQYGN